MDYSAESLRYLHIAFTILIASQVAYAIWLGVRWSRTSDRMRDLRRGR